MYHVTKGPLKTEPTVNFGTLERAFIDAAVAAGHKEIADFNGPKRTGVARTNSTVHRGVRQSSAIAYLKRPSANLTILTEHQVALVQFKGKRAVGIETVSGKTIRTTREVILCQGAFGTPHLLMLSGIGPADHLVANGITPLINLPGVGAHLADHVDVSIQYGSDRMDLSHARYQRLDKAAMLMARWLFNGSGPGGGAMFFTALFHAFEDPPLPELEVFMTPMVVEENLANGEEENAPLMQRLGRKLLVRGRKVARSGVQIDINQERPKSIGTVRLASADPTAYPLIDPNYFEDPPDQGARREGYAQGNGTAPDRSIHHWRDWRVARC